MPPPRPSGPCMGAGIRCAAVAEARQMLNVSAMARGNAANRTAGGPSLAAHAQFMRAGIASQGEEHVGRRAVGLLWAYRLPTIALLFLFAGTIAYVRPVFTGAAHLIWLVGLVLTGAPVVLQTLRGMLRGQFAADIVAALAIIAAVVLNDPLPGLVVVLMQTGGEGLERYAEGHASEAVRSLEEQAPRVAHRVRDDIVEDLDAEAVAVGDSILVRPGEMVPCDGVVTVGRSHVDASRLTGEPVPISAAPGTALLSGSLNGEEPLTLRATRISRESQYARIVELVRTAQASKSPLQRLADRYAVWFTPLTLAVAALAFILSGNSTRILAVLVVATPCPLILATPVAIIGGINSSARRQIVIRNGTALEQLGKVKIGVFDKTGTLTIGIPAVERIIAVPGFDEREVLRLAAAVEQNSGHLLARAVVAEAQARGIALPPASAVHEAAGQGVTGTVEGRRIAVGSEHYLRDLAPATEPALAAPTPPAGGLVSFITVDGGGAGRIEYADRLRPGLAPFFQRLRDLGIERAILLSGDHAAHVQEVARDVGIAEAYGELLPQDKVRIVNELNAAGHNTLMVGDGINDAPALSTATVGVALAGHGGGITAEAADVVILVDELDRVADAVQISQRSLRIAHQSIWVGLGLSGAFMVVAALGYIPPTVGAFIQEGIDVAVILNAIRASGL